MFLGLLCIAKVTQSHSKRVEYMILSVKKLFFTPILQKVHRFRKYLFNAAQ